MKHILMLLQRGLTKLPVVAKTKPENPRETISFINLKSNFMQEARKQPWFENTIFVLLGDHGKLVGSPDCEIPQSYNHVPLMIYGKGIKPEIRQEPGGQTDVPK